MRIHPEGKSRSDLGSDACSQRPSFGVGTVSDSMAKVQPGVFEMILTGVVADAIGGVACRVTFCFECQALHFLFRVSLTLCGVS